MKTGKKILLISMLLWLCNAIGAQQIVEWRDGKTVRKETPMRHGRIDGTVRTYYRDSQ